MYQNAKATVASRIAREVLAHASAQDCPHCAGTGDVRRAIRVRPGFYAEPCRKCAGTGESRVVGFVLLATVSK